MACHVRLRTAHKEGQRRAWHAIISFGQHRRSDDVGRGMPSPPLDSTHGRMTSSVACHNRPWTAHTVGRRRAWYEITALELHARSDVVGRGMISYPFEGKHGRTTSGVTCHHHLWTAHTVEGRWSWHAIITFGKHKRSNDVGRGITSPPLDSTHGRTSSDVVCNHRLWAAHTVERRWAWHDITAFGQHTRSNNVGRGMPSSPLGRTHGRTTSGVV